MAAQVAANPHSTVPNLGASGAIAAVMGAFLVTYAMMHPSLPRPRSAAFGLGRSCEPRVFHCQHS